MKSVFQLLFLTSLLALHFGNAYANFEISDRCLYCMCDVYDGCDIEQDCVLKNEMDICGSHRLSRDYWREAGLGLNSSELGSYVTCSRNLDCSERVISRYVNRHIRDCNGNGVIDCTDMGLVHFFGSSCENAMLRRTNHWISFNACTAILRPNDRIVVTTTPQPTTTKPTVTTKPSTTTKPTTTTTKPKPQRVAERTTISTDEKCAQCLCHALSNCNRNTGCQSNRWVGKICGPFQISPPFWRDTLNRGQSKTDSLFMSCAKDYECSKRSVLTYYSRMQKYCTVTTTNSPCERMYRTHVMGPGGCKRSQIASPAMWNKLVKCYDGK